METSSMPDAISTLDFHIERTDELTQRGAARIHLEIDEICRPDYILDVIGVLFGGASHRSSFYVFTCTCGIAGCEGFHIPVEQTRKDGQVIWEIEDEKLSYVLESDRFVFDAKAFDAAREKLLADIKKLEAEGIYPEALMEEDLSTDEGLLVGVSVDTIAKDVIPYYEQQAKMYEVLDNARVDGDANTMRTIWSTDMDLKNTDGIHNEKLFHHMTPTDLAARLLNLGEALSPEEAERGEALAEVAQILRDFYATADAEAADAAFRPFQHFLVEDNLEEAGKNHFHTDKDGPFVELS
jgi:hypothetical protein